MGQFLNNPTVIIAIVALLGAITNWINSIIHTNEIRALSQQSAKHEQQLNGGFDTRVKSIVDPVVSGAMNRVAQPPSIPPSDIPKVQ